jgi:hypothetical protein
MAVAPKRGDRCSSEKEEIAAAQEEKRLLQSGKRRDCCSPGREEINAGQEMGRPLQLRKRREYFGSGGEEIAAVPEEKNLPRLRNSESTERRAASRILNKIGSSRPASCGSWNEIKIELIRAPRAA